jgi:hypothetical protein
MAGERGLVISCPIKISGTSGLHIVTTALDLQELRFSLLFWDKLDYPTNNLISIGLDREGQFLESDGVLKRTNIRVIGSGDMAAGFVQAHVTAFRNLDATEPGVWSLATGANAVSFPEADFDPGRGVLVSLYRAIPVPDKDVPIQDILEFRARRRDELITLRNYLEDIYERIISAGDGALALDKEIERLKSAVDDHVKVSRESGFKLRLVDIEANLNFVPAVTTAAVSYFAGAPFVASIIAGSAAALNVKIGPSLKRHKATATPFKYVSSYHRELF